MQMLSKSLNWFRFQNQRWRLLRSIPHDIIDTHNQMVEFRNEIAEQRKELTDLRWKVVSQRDEMTKLRTDLNAEITAELGFSFHDFGRGFAEYVETLSADQLRSHSVFSRLTGIESVQADLRDLLGEMTARSNSHSDQLENRLVDTQNLLSQLKNLFGETAAKIDSRLENFENRQAESANHLQHLYTSLHSRLNEASTVQSETKNLVTHVITSIHSRLDAIENEKFKGLNEQMHELTARLFEQGARANDGRAEWVPQAEERYRPAKPVSFEDYLARAKTEYPQTFSFWKERLVATQEAFRQTKVGNAAHAGDPRSRVFRSFVERYATGRVLDVGCGVFGRPYYLTSYPGELISGIDPLTPVEAADFEFIHGISEYLPWPDGSFSTVISATSLDHSLSLDRSLIEMRRILTPRGRILLWIDSVPGSPRYEPDRPTFAPADRFHLFHFDVSWFEPAISGWGEIVDRIELRRAGFSQVMYCIEMRHSKPFIASTHDQVPEC